MFKYKGNTINGIRHFSPREVFEECSGGAILLDLRRESEIGYKSFDVEQIITAQPKTVKENFNDLPKDKPLIVADNAGLRSKEIVEFLQSKGFDNLANLAGGMFEWDKDNLPLIINNNERLSGSCLCVMRPNKNKSGDKK